MLYRARILFLRVDAVDPTHESLLLSTLNYGVEAFPIDSEFGRYVGADNLLQFDAIPSTSKLDAVTLNVTLGISTPEIIAFCTDRGNIQGNHTVIYESEATTEDPPELEANRLWDFAEPVPIFLGRLEHAKANSKVTRLGIQAASVFLSRVTRTADKWSDEQHTLLVRPGDRGFRFATRHGGEVRLAFG